MGAGINISFENLTASVSSGVFRKTEKIVLKSICGEFRERELSVVLGASGAGKSTLLNVLSGLMCKNVSGSIRVNGSSRSYKEVRNESAYISQDQNLHPLLNVHEAMNFAINFKTGRQMSSFQQKEKIFSVLKQLGLIDNQETFVKDLSGGQQKRLSIGIEIISDPMILYLDEPTSGLDSTSATQCVKFLKKLAHKGKTIICTIHTPSALLFKMFDHLYVLAEGSCIYQGSSQNVVPFLADLGLVCPPTYNPGDYLLEISTNDYGLHNQRLTDKIRNGANDDFRLQTKTEIWSELNTFKGQTLKYPASFIHQLYLLICRNLLFMKRDKSLVVLRLSVVLAMAIFTGFLFFQIGALASHVFDTYKFIYFTSNFLCYASYFSLMARFPVELAILRREHFNRWYCSASYYLALSIADAPVIIISMIIYGSITYPMTGQPMEFHRMFLFIVIISAMSFVAQAFGNLAGSMYDLTKTLVIAALLMVPHIAFSGVLVLPKDTHPFLGWVFEANFIKHAIDGLVQTIFLDRGKLRCNEMYCHFQTPETFLKIIDAPKNPIKGILAFPLIFVVVHLVTYYNVNKRLKSTNP